MVDNVDIVSTYRHLSNLNQRREVTHKGVDIPRRASILLTLRGMWAP